jgi:hypothetical protein
MIYDIADDIRKPHGQNNYTLNHLVERMNYYIAENFAYEITEVKIPEPKSNLNII